MSGNRGVPVRRAVRALHARRRAGRLAAEAPIDTAAGRPEEGATPHPPPVADAANPGGLSEAEARRADLLWAGGILLTACALFALVQTMAAAVVPVLVALVGAYALDPIVDAFERRKLSRTASVLALFALIGVAIAGALLYLVPAIGAELAKLPQFFRDIGGKALPRFEALVGIPLPDDVREAVAQLGQRGESLGAGMLPGIGALAMSALSSTAAVIVFLFGLLLVPVLTFHLLHDFDLMVAWCRALIPSKYEPLVSRRFGEVNAVLGGFLRGQLTVGAILTCFYALGLSLARIDLAVVIGAIAGFGVLIPYVGPGVGMALALVSLIVSWQGPWQIGVVAATFAIGMTAEGFYITPRVVGGKVGLSAVVVMIAVLVFGNLFGFAGMLLAVPVTAALKVAGQVALFRYRRTGLFKRGA